jgi:hypothetical protein
VWSRALLCYSGWTCGVEPTLSMFRGHCFHLLLRDGRIAPTLLPRATPPHFVTRELCGPHAERCTDVAMDCRRAQNHAAYVSAVTPLYGLLHSQSGVLVPSVCFLCP